MRHRWKRGAAALLTASMLFSNISMTGLAEEEPAQAEEIATQAEEAPTEAPATEAPTEAPAPATEAPTETPTEKQSESSTQATEKQTDTEKKTEKEMEDGIYTAVEKNYTVSVEVPDDMDLPEGAELVADVVKKDTKEAKEDLKLAEEAAGRYEITGYQIYDLHFEKNNKEIELTPREKADIKVTVVIDKKEFQKDLKEEGLEVFHIRDLTDEELEEQKAESKEDSQSESEAEKMTEAGDSSDKEQTAEKLEIKKAEEKAGKETITFSTDGFSDYLFAVTKEKETEKQSESETVKETEVPATDVETTAPETKEPETVTSETTAPQIAVQEGETQAQQADLTLTVQSVGTDKPTAKDLVIRATNIADLQNAVPAITITQITDTGEKDITADTNAAQITGSQITIAAAIVNSSKGIKISGLPVNGTAAEGEVVPKATYTINAGGNYISNNTFVGNADYYTIYKNTAGVALTPGADGSSQFSLDGDFGITVENVYSEVTLSATGTDKPDKKFDGMKFSVTPEGTTTPVLTAAADNSGIVVIRGLPEGKYTVTGNAGTIPAQYWMESKSQEITVNDQKSLTPSAVLSYKPMTLTVKSVDSRSGKAMANTKITVKKYVSSDKTTTVASATTDSNGQAKLVGVLERGAKYSITQNRVSGHYSATTSDLKSGTYTVEKQGADPTITFSNQPTVVKVGVIDNVSKTSPYSGSYVSGATIAIKKENAVLKTITTEGQLTEVVGLLDPNTKYQIVQTSAPAGYIIGAPTASGKYSVGKQIALSSRTRQEKTVAISADTVKVLVTRKGYDSRTQVTRNGKKAYEYTNLKILSGAKLEIRDKDGNVVKDKNGNAVSWTSSEKGGHLVEGVLAANTEYTLVETGAPTGYDLAGSGVFHTYKSGNQAAVTMQTRRASGTIRVVMRAAYKGNAIKVNGTYYCALFTDKNLTKRYTAAGVRRLTMTTSQVYAEATFENIPAGVYYVAETDKNGNPLKDNATFKVNNPEDGLHMDTSKDLIAEITNDYVTKPAGAQAVSSSELRNSYNAEYAGYGGSASAAAELAAGGNSVQTGDTTNVVLYLSMLAAACILFAAVLIKKRRKE